MKKTNRANKYCYVCGSLLGLDCGQAEPDYNDKYCSVGCYNSRNLDKMKDILHSEKLSKGDNIKVFSEVYDRISSIVDERVDMEMKAFNIEPDDRSLLNDITTSRSKYYYNEILDIVNLVLNKWKN